MALFDLPDEILYLIVEQIRTEAFDEHQNSHRLPCLNTLCALALTSRRFTKLTFDAIHREVRLVGSRQQARYEPDDERKARWRCWTQSCNKYPQMLDRVKVLRVLWFASFDQDLVDHVYSCLGQLSNLQHLSLTVWTPRQQDSIMGRIGIDPLLPPNLRILELSFHTKQPIKPRALSRICHLPSLQVLTLQFRSAVFDFHPDETGPDEEKDSKEGSKASNLEVIVLDCKFLDHRVLDFLVKSAPTLKQLTIPDMIGITNSHENQNWLLELIPMRPASIDLILQRLTDTLEHLTITTPRDYNPRLHRKKYCERIAGFSTFSALKSLDVPVQFLFDLSGDTELRTNYELFPKSLQSLKLRFEYFFTIHELEQEWGMSPSDWYDAYKLYETSDHIVGTQQCQWIGLLLKQDKNALEMLRQVYARDESFDVSHQTIVAIDRKISGAFDGVDVSVRIRASEKYLQQQVTRQNTAEHTLSNGTCDNIRVT